jgi:hypothetical protein
VLLNSLDDFIDIRLGRGSQHAHIDPLAPFTFAPPSSHISSASLSSIPTTPTTPTPPAVPSNEVPTADAHSRSARIRAFRAMQRATPAERERMQQGMDGVRASGQRTTWTAIHLLSAEEVKSLFKDVVEGLAFLVNHPFIAMYEIYC